MKMIFVQEYVSFVHSLVSMKPGQSMAYVAQLAQAPQDMLIVPMSNRLSISYFS